MQRHTKTAHQNYAGFTMIELLVVVSLSVMLMLATSTLFLTFLIGRTKVTAIKQVKDEGQYAMSRMEFLIRNATEILPNSQYPAGCQADMQSLTIRSVDNGITTLYAEVDTDGRTKIASNSGVYLTSGSLDLIAGPTFDCSQQTDASTQHVVISFSLRRGNPGEDDVRETAESDFKTAVSIRSL